MKLKYSVPHKVTLRMVGVQFVATCSCKKWSQQTDPRKYDRPDVAGIGSFLQGILPSPVNELIMKAHEHATDHILEAHRLTRKTAA